MAITNIPKTFEINVLPNVSNFTAVVADVCRNESVNILLSGLGSITNFKITYQLSGANTSVNQSVSLSANGGLSAFLIPSNLITASGTTTILISSLTDLLSNCEAPLLIAKVFNINPVPNVPNFVVSIPNVCQNNAVLATFSNLGNITDLNIEYSLSGANIAPSQTANLLVNAGNATLTIPSNLVAIAGMSTFNLIKSTIVSTGCSSGFSISKSFTVNLLPDVTNFNTVIADYCKNEVVVVALTGLLNLTNIQLVYSLSGANNITNQTINLAPVNGVTSFIIPSNFLLNVGLSTVTISKLIHVNTACETLILNKSEIFTIFDKPNIPATSPKSFCKEDNPTITNLTPSGTFYNWFDALNSTTVLASNTSLVSGNYFVEATNHATGCVSDRAVLAVFIVELQPPILNQNGQNFCGADNPVIANLTTNASAFNAIAWYDSAINGNLLPESQLLQDNFTYYGFEISSDINCKSAENLKVTVLLTNCNQNQYDFFIPDGFSPNGDNINDTFRIPDIEFLFPDYSVEIYNRYGNLMFKGNINKPNWNGISTNSDNLIDGFAPNGVYFYTLNFNKNNVSPKQGRLYLNR